MKTRDPTNLTRKDSLRFLLDDTIVYGGAAAFSKAFSLITFPIIARHFSTEDFGIIDFFAVFASFLGTLLIFGQDSAVARFFYEYDDPKKRQQLISDSFLLQIALSIFCILFLIIFVEVLASYLIDVPDAKACLLLVAIQAPFLVILNFSKNLLKWTFQRGRFLFVSLGITISGTLLLVISIYWLNVGVVGVLGIGLINSAIFSLIGLWLVRDWLIFPTQLKFLKILVKFALPIGIIGSVGAFVPAAERWLISQLLNFDDLGMYAAGARIAMVMALISSAFQTAWGPFSLSLYKQENATEIYNLVLKIYTLMAVFSSFLIAGCAFPLIVILATERYSEGMVVVLPLTLALCIQSIGWIVEIGISISKRSYLQLYAYTVYLIISIAAIYLFTSSYGIIGVSFGILAGHISKTLVASYLAQLAHPINWDYKPVLFYTGFSIFSGIGILLTTEQINANGIAIILTLSSFSLLAGGALFLFSRDELIVIKRVLTDGYKSTKKVPDGLK